MTHSPSWSPGNPWGVCQRCGFDVRLNALKMEWTKLLVCDKCYDRRHPQDFVRPKLDRQVVRRPAPKPEDLFVDVGDITKDSF